MRPDMKDLLVNTGRSGDYGYQRARFKATDPDLLPRRFSATEFIYYKRSTGDRLRPLYRFLEHNCGRPWAQVYSEICQVSDHRSIRGYHLRTHVDQYVVSNNYDVGHRRSHGPFFVDTDGTLQEKRELTEAERHQRWLNSKWGKEQKLENPKITDTPDHWWEKIEGYWYEFTVTHTTIKRSMEDLAMVNGNVEIIRIQLKDAIHDETKKRQVDAKTTKKLEATLRQAA